MLARIVAIWIHLNTFPAYETSFTYLKLMKDVNVAMIQVNSALCCLSVESTVTRPVTETAQYRYYLITLQLKKKQRKHPQGQFSKMAQWKNLYNHSIQLSFIYVLT
jgi:hypothetical protein